MPIIFRISLDCSGIGVLKWIFIFHTQHFNVPRTFPNLFSSRHEYTAIDCACTLDTSWCCWGSWEIYHNLKILFGCIFFKKLGADSFTTFFGIGVVPYFSLGLWLNQTYSSVPIKCGLIKCSGAGSIKRLLSVTFSYATCLDWVYHFLLFSVPSFLYSLATAFLHISAISLHNGWIYWYSEAQEENRKTRIRSLLYPYAAPIIHKKIDQILRSKPSIPDRHTYCQFNDMEPRYFNHGKQFIHLNSKVGRICRPLLTWIGQVCLQPSAKLPSATAKRSSVVRHW